jgi:hypothetical protein
MNDYGLDDGMNMVVYIDVVVRNNLNVSLIIFGRELCRENSIHWSLSNFPQF